MRTSVVIPTTGRPSLLAAVESVENQTVGRESIEIVVVVDAPPHGAPIDPSLEDRVDKLVYTGGVGNGGYARHLGFQHSTGEWVAFLDDDDEWTSTKLAVQLDAGASLPRLSIVAGRVLERSPAGAHTEPIPAVVYQHGQVEDYLFKRRSPSPGRASIFTSTLLVRRELLEQVPWRTDLSRHQDWDLLVRAQRAGASIVQVNDVVATIAVGSIGSISAGSKWRDSLDWVASAAEDWNRQTAVDFVAAQTLRYALQARSIEGVSACVKFTIARRALPTIPTLLVGVAGLVPRRTLERLFFLRRPAAEPQ